MDQGSSALGIPPNSKQCLRTQTHSKSTLINSLLHLWQSLLLLAGHFLVLLDGSFFTLSWPRPPPLSFPAPASCLPVIGTISLLLLSLTSWVRMPPLLPFALVLAWPRDFRLLCNWPLWSPHWSCPVLSCLDLSLSDIILCLLCHLLPFHAQHPQKSGTQSWNWAAWPDWEDLFASKNAEFFWSVSSTQGLWTSFLSPGPISLVLTPGCYPRIWDRAWRRASLLFAQFCTIQPTPQPSFAWNLLPFLLTPGPPGVKDSTLSELPRVVQPGDAWV